MVLIRDLDGIWSPSRNYNMVHYIPKPAKQEKEKKEREREGGR